MTDYCLIFNAVMYTVTMSPQEFAELLDRTILIAGNCRQQAIHLEEVKASILHKKSKVDISHLPCLKRGLAESEATLNQMVSRLKQQYANCLEGQNDE